MLVIYFIHSEMRRRSTNDHLTTKPIRTRLQFGKLDETEVKTPCIVC